MLTTAITNAQTAIVNNDASNKTMIVNNDNANALTLNTSLTSAKTMVIANDNTNTTNIVSNDNANKVMLLAAINASQTTFGTMLLRSQIEANLAKEGDDDEAGNVAWFLTPTANGGQLDLVQQIVTQTLANIVAAGGSIHSAQTYLTRANAYKTAGNFKAAYEYYRKAYKAAAK